MVEYHKNYIIKSLNLKIMRRTYYFKTKGVITLVLFLCMTFVLSSLNYAQVVATVGPIDIDGNPEEWPDVLPPGLGVEGSVYIKDVYNSNVDDQLAQHAKDVNDIDIWHWNYGNTNDKTDIQNVGAAIINHNDTMYLAFFGDRQAPNGDANIGFWLLLDGSAPDTNTFMFSPGHNASPGDILVLSNFLNGGGVPDFRVYQWDGSDPVEITGTTGESAVNTEHHVVPSYTSPDGDEWTFTPKSGSGYEIGLFFEGYIDLTGILTETDLCNATVLFETRNSQSINAQLGDFAAGKFNTSPEPPEIDHDEACADDGAIELCVIGYEAGDVLNWYDVDPSLNPGATPIATGVECINVILTVTTSYWVTATNALGCEGAPAEVVGTIFPEPVLDPLSPTHVSCNGYANGEIEASWTGGTADFRIKLGFAGSWVSPVTSPYSFTGLTAGTYTVYLEDANGCEDSQEVTVNEPNVLGLALTPTGASCFGSSNGSISAVITGTPLSDLEIDIDGGGYSVVAASPVVFNGLAEGNHTVTLRRISDNSCNTFDVAYVSQPDELDLALTPTGATCYGFSNGSISAVITGTPLSDLEIDIDGGGYAAVAASPVVFNGLAEGNHTVTLRRISDNSCNTFDVAYVSQPDELDLALTPTGATCYGYSNGSISAVITGTPLSDLEIDIDGGGYAAVAASPVVFNGLAEGNHTVTLRRISDNSCNTFDVAYVSQPDELDLALTPTGATCYGFSNGSISAVITGTPLSDLEIDIDGGGYAAVAASPVVFNGLAEGNHTVTLRRISDNSCNTFDVAYVSEPDELDLTLTPTDALCFGDNMSISAVITGTPFTDLEIQIDADGWNPVTASPVVFNGLTEGNHVVYLRRISDNNCSTDDNADVYEPTLLTCYTDNIVSATCGESNGQATVYISGGTQPYDILWDNGETGATAYLLSPGFHTVYITDDNDCETECYVTIPDIPCDGFCFYTQGFYGNEGGLGWTIACDQWTALQMMQYVLPSGSEMLGVPANHFSLVSGDITAGGNIFNMLPGGGTPNAIDYGVATYANLSSWGYVPLSTQPSKYGKILNNLLSQSITFYFNLGHNAGAEFHSIDGNMLVTAPSDCDFENVLIASKDTFEIPQTVIDYLGVNNTLGDLYMLAKDVLGDNASGISAADVTMALDAYNNGFDECRAFVEYYTELKSVSDNSGSVYTSEDEISMTAYPNPFSAFATIEFTVPVDMDVTLEVYTLQGQKVETLYSGNAASDVTHKYKFYGKDAHNESVYVYMLKTEDSIEMGKLIMIK